MTQKDCEKAMIQYAENRNRHEVDISAWTRQATKNVRRVHRMVPGYRETPLRPLNDLADRLGVRAVLVKDESGRFGLKAFKGLGGVYAMFRILCRELGLDENSTTLDDLKMLTNDDLVDREEEDLEARNLALQFAEEEPEETVEIAAESEEDLAAEEAEEE